MTLMYFTCKGKTPTKSHDQKPISTKPVINTNANGKKTVKSMLLGIKSAPCGSCGGAR